MKSPEIKSQNISVVRSSSDGSLCASICIATYNGERYIKQQLESILDQINDIDEIVVIDDCSTDNTVAIIQNFNSARIKLVINEYNVGHVQSFAKAIQYSCKNIIFLSDQDDVWCDGRLELMKTAFALHKPYVIASNFSEFFDSDLYLSMPDSILYSSDSIRNFSNIVGIFLGRRPYFGCCMAFSRDIIDIIMPIPKIIEAHDIWIAMAGNFMCRVLHLDGVTIMRRIHQSNLTSRTRRGMWSIVVTRLIFVASLIILSKRIFLKRICSGLRNRL